MEVNSITLKHFISPDFRGLKNSLSIVKKISAEKKERQSLSLFCAFIEPEKYREVKKTGGTIR